MDPSTIASAYNEKSAITPSFLDRVWKSPNNPDPGYYLRPTEGLSLYYPPGKVRNPSTAVEPPPLPANGNIHRGARQSQTGPAAQVSPNGWFLRGRVLPPGVAGTSNPTGRNLAPIPGSSAMPIEIPDSPASRSPSPAPIRPRDRLADPSMAPSRTEASSWQPPAGSDAQLPMLADQGPDIFGGQGRNTPSPPSPGGSLFSESGRSTPAPSSPSSAPFDRPLTAGPSSQGAEQPIPLQRPSQVPFHPPPQGHNSWIDFLNAPPMP
jgi:hypothetical protein